jgi:hypothetical protein
VLGRLIIGPVISASSSSSSNTAAALLSGQEQNKSAAIASKTANTFDTDFMVTASTSLKNVDPSGAGSNPPHMHSLSRACPGHWFIKIERGIAPFKERLLTLSERR